MIEIVKALPLAPRTCTWELSRRCNLNCGHCGTRAGRPRSDEMSLDRMLRTTGELSALGCKRLTLSGGEPTISPHWSSVTEEGTRLGVHVNMITNGVTADRSLVQRAKDAGLRSLGVSLDGIEATHDRIRGMPGLYRRVMRLLDDCAAVGMPVGVITTLWRGSVRELEALHDALAGTVYVWQPQLGMPMGNFGDHADDQIAPDDLLWIVPLIARLVGEQRVSIEVGDNIGYFGPYEPVIRAKRRTPLRCWVGCYAGCRHLGVEADGGIKGCLSLQATTATEGNLHRESLHAIWSRPKAFAYNRQFSMADLRGFCRTCEHAAMCRGGCLSLRTSLGGGENLFCYHRVATLAARAAKPARRYTPLAVVPAAILGMFGIACTATIDEPPPADAPAADAGTDRDGSAIPFDDAKPDVPREVGPAVTLTDAYGLGDVGPRDVPVIPDVSHGDAYGLPDVAVDVAPGDAYGIPDVVVDVAPGDAYGIPDVVVDVAPGDAYGIPDVVVDVAPGDAYGIPDVVVDVAPGDAYGIPDADAD